MQILKNLWDTRPSEKFSGLKVPLLLLPSGVPSSFSKSKDEEIAGLRKTLRVINSHVNRFQQEEFFKSNANKTTERNQNSDMDNQNQGVNHASLK
jgi:hypothetical protein